MIIISDTSPLSSLALVGYLSILKDIYTDDLEIGFLGETRFLYKC